MQNIKIKNKRAKFDYELLEVFDAGIQLRGTEIKSIRLNKASIAESFCQVIDSELYVVNMQIDEYAWGTHFNHKSKRQRKLLLTKNELKRIIRKTKDKGLTIIPTLLYINNTGLAKLRIAIAKGKRDYDKRQTIKTKDLSRDLGRIVKKL